MGRYAATIILVLTGIGLLAGAAWFARDTLELRDRADRVDGRIASYSSRRDSDGDMSYRPTYAFEYRGRQREHASRIGSPSRPDIGSEVTLLVDPDDPTRIKPETFMGQWFVPFLLGVMGLTTLLAGTVVALAVRRSLQGAKPDPEPVRHQAAPVTAAESTDTDRRGPFL